MQSCRQLFHQSDCCIHNYCDVHFWYGSHSGFETISYKIMKTSASALVKDPHLQLSFLHSTGKAFSTVDFHAFKACYLANSDPSLGNQTSAAEAFNRRTAVTNQTLVTVATSDVSFAGAVATDLITRSSHRNDATRVTVAS